MSSLFGAKYLAVIDLEPESITESEARILTFRTEISGQTTISILETSLFRNSVNDDIPIVARENGLIDVISD